MSWTRSTRRLLVVGEPAPQTHIISNPESFPRLGQLQRRVSHLQRAAQRIKLFAAEWTGGELFRNRNPSLQRRCHQSLFCIFAFMHFPWFPFSTLRQRRA